MEYARIVRHGVCTDGWGLVDALEWEESELLPCWEVGVANEALVDVLVVVDEEGWNLDLCVGTWLEVHVLAWRQGHFVFLDEGCHVLVANNGAFPFLNAHYRIVNLNLEVALHLTLAPQTPVLLNLLTGEMTFLRVENVATACRNLQFALSARTLAAAS